MERAKNQAALLKQVSVHALPSLDLFSLHLNLEKIGAEKFVIVKEDLTLQIACFSLHGFEKLVEI